LLLAWLTIFRLTRSFKIVYNDDSPPNINILLISLSITLVKLDRALKSLLTIIFLHFNYVNENIQMLFNVFVNLFF